MRNNSLYKFVITSIILILALSVSGWGECHRDTYTYDVEWGGSCINFEKPDGTYYSDESASALYCCIPYGESQPSNYKMTIKGTSDPTYRPSSRGYLAKIELIHHTPGSSDCLNGTGWRSYIRYVPYYCSSKSEADSVKCALNPSLPGCCDAHCECDKAGGTWHPNGYCVKDCQTEACCDSLNVPQVAYDSVYIWQNNSCALHWRCESPQAECVAINGLLVADVLPDTTTQGGTTTITNKCYYNCGRVIPSDSSKSMVDGNIVLPSSVSLISQGIKTPNQFDAVRSENDNKEYTYDFLSPQAQYYLDSIAFTPCTQTLYRCVLNNKYVYYYDNQTAPAGCTKTVKIK